MAGVWAAGSVLLLIFRPGYGFPPFELLDSWIYTGYQWAPRAQISDFGATYYGSRLSWILPGALLHHWLPPTVAEIAFKLCFSALLAGSVGVTVHSVAGLRWALFSVTATVYSPMVVQALHADYPDTPVFAYAAATLAMITLARDSSRWPWWIGGAGVSFALMAVANLGSLSTLGAALAIYHFVWLQWPLRRHLSSLGCYGAGAMFAITALGVAHVYLGGKFYFLKAQVDMVLFFKNLEDNPWSPTEPLWALSATWLTLPFLALAWGLVCQFLPATPTSRTASLVRALTAALAVSLGLAIIWEARRTAAVLSLYYYATFHLALALPLLGACAAHLWQGTFRFRYLFATCTGLIAMVLWLPPLTQCRSLVSLSHGLLPRYDWMEVSLALILGTMSLAGLLLLRKHALARCSISMFLIGACTLLSMPNGFRGPQISDRLRERYLSVHSAFFTVASEYPDGSYRYWIDARNRDGVSLASTKLWGYRLISLESFPQLDTDKHIHGTVILLLPQGEYDEALKQIPDSLAPWGLAMSSHRLHRVAGKAETGFDLLAFEFQKLDIDPIRPPPGLRGTITMIAGFEYYSPARYTDNLRIEATIPPEESPIDTSRGIPYLMRNASDVAVSTDLRVLASLPVGKSRSLLIAPIMPAKGSCEIIVQDQHHREISRFVLTQSGRTVHRMNLPADTTSYRLCLSSPDEPNTPMPVNINIYEWIK